MEKIGKDEFIRQLQKSLLKDGIELSLDNLDKIVDSVLSTIEDNVVKGDSVEFVGFGKFLPRHHNARSDHDLQGNEIEVEAHETPAFEPGDSFKEMLRK